MNLEELLRIAAILHIGLLCAGATMPFAVNLRAQLASLPCFPRRLFYVYYGFIGLVLASLGMLTWLNAPMLANGTGARGLAVFLAVFWILRLLVAAFVLDVRPFLTTWVRRLGYHALNAVFLYLTIVYSWTAIKTLRL